MKMLLKVIAGSVALSLTETARACTTCMGSADAPIAPAVNASMGFLLVVIALVASAFFAFLIYLARRDGLPLE